MCYSASKSKHSALPGAPLVKALPVNPTDPSVTGPDLFSKLVPMAAHEASSLYRYVPSLGVRHMLVCSDSQHIYSI